MAAGSFGDRWFRSMLPAGQPAIVLIKQPNTVAQMTVVRIRDHLKLPRGTTPARSGGS